MDTQTVYDGGFKPYDQVLVDETEILKNEVRGLLEKMQRPYRILLVSFNKKKSYICSRDCFSQDIFSLSESFSCQKSCLKPLELIKQDQEANFARYDVGNI